MPLRCLSVLLCVLLLFLCASCKAIPDFNSSTTTQYVKDNNEGFKMPSTEIQGVEVISITPMIPAKEISLSTACFTVKITKIELREVRVLASGETEKIVLLHYTVTNHTQSHIRRVIAVDFFLREGSQALTQSREHIQFGMEEPEENWDLIRAGETAQLVYALTQIEPAVTFESVELSVMVYDNTKHYESEGNAREDHVLLSLQ